MTLKEKLLRMWRGNASQPPFDPDNPDRPLTQHEIDQIAEHDTENMPANRPDGPLINFPL